MASVVNRVSVVLFTCVCHQKHTFVAAVCERKRARDKGIADAILVLQNAHNEFHENENDNQYGENILTDNIDFVYVHKRHVMNNVELFIQRVLPVEQVKLIRKSCINFRDIRLAHQFNIAIDTLNNNRDINAQFAQVTDGIVFNGAPERKICR